MDISFLHIFFFPLSPTKLLQDLTIRGAGWVSYTKQELLTLLKHLGWLPIFGGVHVAHLFSFLCCVLSVFVLCLVCPMLPVFLDCPFLIALSVFSNVYKHLPISIQKRQIHIFQVLLFSTFDCRWKSMEIWVGKNNLVFYNGYNVSTLLRNLWIPPHFRG